MHLAGKLVLHLVYKTRNDCRPLSSPPHAIPLSLSPSRLADGSARPCLNHQHSARDVAALAAFGIPTAAYTELVGGDVAEFVSELKTHIEYPFSKVLSP